MAELRFTKMQALGNDFVVLDNITHPDLPSLTPTQIAHVSNRRLGIGCDQLIVIDPPQSPELDFHVRFFNANGSEAEHCGNGIRCAALLVRHSGLTSADTMTFGSVGGPIRLLVHGDRDIEAEMGMPEVGTPETVQLEEREMTFRAVTLRNPHAVFGVDEVKAFPVPQIGALIQRNPRFPHSVNASFVECAERHRIRLRVCERGVGETTGCGSAACATVAALHTDARVDNNVTVQLPGGDLQVHWPGPGQPINLRGPAHISFDGALPLAALSAA